jgi:hypothetical protein
MPDRRRYAELVRQRLAIGRPESLPQQRARLFARHLQRRLRMRRGDNNNGEQDADDQFTKHHVSDFTWLVPDPSAVINLSQALQSEKSPFARAGRRRRAR